MSYEPIQACADWERKRFSLHPVGDTRYVRVWEHTICPVFAGGIACCVFLYTLVGGVMLADVQRAIPEPPIETCRPWTTTQSRICVARSVRSSGGTHSNGGCQ